MLLLLTDPEEEDVDDVNVVDVVGNTNAVINKTMPKMNFNNAIYWT